MIKKLIFITIMLYCVTSKANEAINSTLDNFHLAAAQANYDTYFDLLDDEGVFLGTDGTERWTKEEFRLFVKPYFSKGIGWRYQSTKRNISLIEGNKLAFFDELLFNDNYGQCRGSGVLIKKNNEWKILQYNLSIPIPNKLSSNVVDLIKTTDES